MCQILLYGDVSYNCSASAYCTYNYRIVESRAMSNGKRALY